MDVDISFLFQEKEKHQIDSKIEEKSVIHEGETDSSDDEDNKYPESAVYSSYGKSIKKLLNKKPVANEPSKNKKLCLPVAQENLATFLTDPFFKLTIINPLVSLQFLQKRMEGRKPVTMWKLKSHVLSGDLTSDWVIGGVLVSKTGIKKSQKGSNFIIWKLSDLKEGLLSVSVFLFGHAYENLWKTTTGTALGILNPTVMDNKNNGNKSEITLSISHHDQVMLWGTSKDFGLCKSTKANGERCSLYVNLSKCEYCDFHVQKEYKKFTGRAGLQGATCGDRQSLRNKVLGKNEVFYGGKSFCAVQGVKNQKVVARDKALLNSLRPKVAEASLPPPKPDPKFVPSFTRARTVLSKLPDQNKESPSAEAADNAPLNTASPSLSNPELDTLTFDLDVTTPNKTKKEEKSLKTFFNKLSALPTEKFPKTSNLKPKQPVVNKTTLSPAPNKIKVQKPLPQVKELTAQETVKDHPSESIQQQKSKEKISPDNPDESQSSEKRRISHASKTESTKKNRVDQLLTKIINNADKPQGVNIKQVEEVPGSSQLNMSVDAELQGIDFSCFETPMISSEPNKEQHVGSNDSAEKNIWGNSSYLKISTKNISKAKLKAIQFVKQHGSISVKKDKQAIIEKNLKRSRSPAQEEDGAKKPRLSERVLEVIKMTTKHPELVEAVTQKVQEDYLEKMEKKEQMEEKMLTTFKVECKAVRCLKCKYTWFSASDYCKAEGHPYKVIDAIKRFFKCGNCSNRTVCLSVIPLHSCKTCGSSNWERAPMMKEKKIMDANPLSIRGGEQKSVGGTVSNANLNLLIPE